MNDIIKKNTKILLLQTPFKELKFGNEWRRTESLTPPQGLMYLATPLINEGYSVSFIDLNVDRFEEQEFIDVIKVQDFVLISIFSRSLMIAKQIIEMVKKANKNTFVMCGGPYCNLSQKFVEGSDMTVVGEAEGCIDDILDRILSKKLLTNVPGLIYKHKNKIIRNPGILQVKDINQSQNSSYKLAQDKEYGYFFGHKIKGITAVITSRGCAFKCTFCTYRKFIGYRERSVENVIEELKDLQAKGYKYIIFYDDNFLMNKKRAVKIMDQVIKEKIRLRFAFGGRIDSTDLKFYKKLRRAGVILIMYGIENANQDVLDFYQKQITIDKIKKVIELTNKVGIIIGGYFMLGSPLEDKEHFIVNKKFVESIPLDYIHVNILGYSQGSRLWHDALKAGLIKENEIVVRANEKLSQFSWQEWEVMREELVKGFYSRPSRIIRLLWKIARLGLLPHFLKIIKTLLHTKKDFFKKGKSALNLYEKTEIKI